MTSAIPPAPIAKRQNEQDGEALLTERVDQAANSAVPAAGRPAPELIGDPLAVR